ncbi:MAG TPA: hypothetical protein VFU13_17070 [Steroidobacteraceae bacterium]|nr:hypothetical protein [Steroidobacteraceae bacterium]
MTLVLFALLAHAGVVAAAEPAPGALKEGWNEEQIETAAYSCTEGLLQPTLRDYKAAAAARGNTNPKPFPEQAFRESALPMCSCIVRRAAEIMTLAEFGNGANKKTDPLIQEAMEGGRCKPEGLLGDMIERARAKAAN